jgi:hypothetical protein
VKKPAFLVAAALSVAALPSVGCAWTSDGGLGARLVSPEVMTESAADTWAGEPIAIYDQHGTITIVGVPGKTNITLRAKLVAGATSQADADAAFKDLGDQLTVVKIDGTWTVRCTKAHQWHGSVDPESTGCTDMRLEVPAGSVDQPLRITARADYGGVHTSGITVAKLTASAPFGLVGDVVPTKGAEIDMKGDDSLASGFCSTILRVPAGTALDAVDLSVREPEAKIAGVDPNDTRWWPGVEVHGLPELSQSIAPRTASFAGTCGTPGAGAKSIVLHADVGKAIVGTDPVPSPAELGNCQNVDPAVYNASAGN